MKLSSFIEVELLHHEGILFFRPSSTGNTTTVDVELVFNETASPEEIPSAGDVVETLRIAAVNTSAGNISFDPNSIVLIGMLTCSSFDPMMKETPMEYHANNKCLVALVRCFSLIPTHMYMKIYRYK